MKSGLFSIFRVFCLFPCISTCCRVSEKRLNRDDFDQNGHFIIRSQYNRRSFYEDSRRQFLLPKESDPKLGQLVNGSKTIEFCKTWPMFSECPEETCKNAQEIWTKHTGETCFLLQCLQESRCHGIHCQCCDILLCNIQVVDFQITQVETNNITMKNCSRTTMDDPCTGRSHQGVDLRFVDEAVCPHGVVARDEVETFLNVSCGFVSCHRYHVCQGVLCDCCDQVTCWTDPLNVAKNKDFQVMDREEQNLIDLAHFHHQVPYDPRAHMTPYPMPSVSTKRPQVDFPNRRTTPVYPYLNPEGGFVYYRNRQNNWNVYRNSQAMRNHRNFSKYLISIILMFSSSLNYSCIMLVSE